MPEYHLDVTLGARWESNTSTFSAIADSEEEALRIALIGLNANYNSNGKCETPSAKISKQSYIKISHETIISDGASIYMAIFTKLDHYEREEVNRLTFYRMAEHNGDKARCENIGSVVTNVPTVAHWLPGDIPLTDSYLNLGEGKVMFSVKNNKIYMRGMSPEDHLHLSMMS